MMRPLRQMSSTFWGHIKRKANARLLTRLYSSSRSSIQELISRCVHDEESVSVKGWVRGLREHKEVTFVQISDGSCLQNLQVVVPTCKLPRETSFGSCIHVTGVLTRSLGKGQLSEVLMNSMRIVGGCNANEFPIKARKRHTPDYLREFIHLRPRTNMFGAMLRLRSAATKALNDFFSDDGYIQIHTPIITGNDCEGAGEVFRIQPLEKANEEKSESTSNGMFFNVPAYLTVSGQLHLEIMASSFNKVYTFNPTFRAENSRGRHHLSEFWMIEAELAFIETLEELMSVIERLLKTVTENLMSNHSEDVDLFLQHVAPDGHRDIINCLLKNRYIRMPYSDAVDILSSCSENFQYKPKWGADLHKEHERYLVKHCGNTPVFVTDFPKETKAFYARENDDGKTVAAVDLLGANVGELCGGSLREERYTQIKQKLDPLGNVEDYEWYLDLRRYGSSPHGGFGIGFERYLQALLGINNIRDVIPFPRSRSNCKM